MPNISKNSLKAKKITLKKLLDVKNAALVNEMYEVYRVCFKGWDKNQFIQYLNKIGPSSILYLISHQNMIVGYNIVIIEEHQILNKKCYTISGEWASLPPYRSRFKNLFYSTKIALLFFLKHPFSTLIYLDVIMNYRIYRTLNLVMKLMPTPNQEIPCKYKKIITDFTSKHGFELEENGYSVNTYDNSSSSISNNERIKDLELYKYFMEKTYNGTRGLVVLKPLNLKLILWILLNSLAKRSKKVKSSSVIPKT